jgi:hypothetical protein
LWHDEKWIEKNLPRTDSFDYSQIDSLNRFEGSHPFVMTERIRRKNWQFDFDPTQKNFSPTSRILHSIDKLTGCRLGEYKNYRILH